ncbi:VQ protein [Dillenia turbinata]|uniref:VQ protein n=1 Tax=Dillenia turbinata TaxID=194707 RepID=A0AAN8UP57_9MAGN
MEAMAKHQYNSTQQSPKKAHKQPMKGKKKPTKVTYISSPVMVRACNESEFRAIVQELTGKDSTVWSPEDFGEAREQLGDRHAFGITAESNNNSIVPEDNVGFVKNGLRAALWDVDLTDSSFVDGCLSLSAFVKGPVGRAIFEQRRQLWMSIFGGEKVMVDVNKGKTIEVEGRVGDRPYGRGELKRCRAFFLVEDDAVSTSTLDWSKNNGRDLAIDDDHGRRR